MLPDTPPSLRERKKTATRERIYIEALELFRQKGFAATTIEEIAEAAEISRGTFFNYFVSKEGLLHYLGERQSVAIAEEVRRALLDPRLTARDRLARLLRRLAVNLESDRELTRLAVFEAVKVPEALVADPYRRLFRQAIVGLLAEGQRQGEVHAGLDPELAGSAVMGVYLQQVFEWCAAEPPFPLAERIDRLADLMWDGLSPAA
jgi:AcrR family transcriptional regulator